jgi:hypothetical protein
LVLIFAQAADVSSMVQLMPDCPAAVSGFQSKWNQELISLPSSAS